MAASRWPLVALLLGLLLASSPPASLAEEEAAWESCAAGCPDLSAHNLDLAPLRGMWEAVYLKETESSTTAHVPYFFNFTLCNPLPDTGSCKDSSHVCFTKYFDEFYSLGSHASCQYRYSERRVQFSFSYGDETKEKIGNGNVSITLICGRSLGVPEVIKGDPDDLEVEILWITSAACKTTSPLAARNESKCYFFQHSESSGTKAHFVDLSGLIRPVGFEGVHAARTEARFQISVCRPLETEDACNGAAVCLKTNDSHFELEKEATTPLALAYDEGAESRLLLQGSLLTVSYWGRDKLSICGGSRRQVDVHFLCPTEDEEYGPSVSYLDDSLCLVLVNWFTSYACGTTAVEARGCQLTTSTGVHFDLSGLGGDKVVTASGPGEHPYSYALEICSGRELTGDCAGGGPGDAPVRAAQFDGGTCRSLGTGDGKLRYADGVLSLTYTFGETCHSNYARTSVVNFVCSEDVSKNATGLSFLGEENCHYEFEWATPLACRGAESSGVASCHFELGGHEYNFSPLVGTADKNWVAVDDDRTTECFLINPCGEVATKSETKTAAELCQSRLAPESACSGTSVCQVLRNGTGVRIGRFNLQAVSNLTLVDTNVVTVIGEGDAHHKAVVHYVCKTGDMTSPPVFVGKTNGAFYEFHWATFAACPLGVQTGSDCLVTDATTGFAFNLTALKPFKYLFIGAGYDFDLAVCAELNGTDCPAHTALCQTGTDNGHAKSLGLVNSTLIYADGTLKLHYTGGDPCSKWPHRNSTIIFLCDSSAHFPVVNHIQEDYCQYVVEVRTKLACPPAFRATECALVQDNVTLDFSVLSRETGNWQAVGPDGAAYYINLCQPLNRVVGCSPLAAVCKVKMEGGKVTYTNLGLASSAEFVPLGDRPSFHEEHVVMSYSYSHPAASQGSECETTHVKIFLVCDHTAEEETSPEFTSGGDKADPCTYTFHWRTLAACRVRPVTSRTCFLTDPESGYTFDLNPVHSPEHAFYSVSDGHFAYNVTACAPLVGDCKSGQANATLCQGLVSAAAGDRTKNFKCGDFSTQRLRYLDGSLVLSYGGGEPCHHPKPGTPRSVVINFECDRSLYVGTPKYIHEQDCQYVFEWPTALACKPRELECVAGGGKYDLRPLLESREWQVNLQGVDMGPWEVVIGGCRSLDLSARPECPQIPGLAACSFVPGYKPGHATALGFVTGDLVEEERGVLRLSYHNGDRCHSDGGRGRNHVVNVFFRCDTGEGVGVPTAISNSNCSLDIDWVTRYACPRDTPGPASSSSSAAAWTLTDPVSSHTYNLTTITPLLSADTSLEVGSPSHQYTYTLGLGGKPVPCAGSHGDVKEKNFGACQTRTSGDPSPKLLGQVNSTLLLVGGKVKVIYTGGDICHHNGVHRKTVVTFECDRSREGDARLEVLPEEDCEYAMLVFTKLACHAQQDIGVECLVPGFSDIGSLANMHTPAITVETGLLGAAAVMYLSVCQPIGFGNQVEGTAVANCPGGSAACVHWKGNNTWMSLGRPDRLQPPRLLDAGNGVVLSYSGGDSCGGGGLKTKLVLLCNRNELEGAPTFVGREGCQFMFRWESRFACPIQIPSSNVSTTQCSISDPASGHNFSFTKLSSQVVRGKGSATPTYHIQLCGSAPASGSDCSGICRETSGGGRTSLLGAKHRFVITSHSPHVIEVVYPSGTECSRGRKWEGLVTLQCKPRNGTAAPVLVSDSDCRLEFLWQNESFCVGEEVCVAVDTKTGYTYDLDGLLSTRWSGTSENGKDSFLMAVCRNLNPFSSKADEKCGSPSGICLSSGGLNINLGHMTAPPRVDHHGDEVVLVLDYVEGDVCAGSRKPPTTRVELHCSHKQSSPVLSKGADGCTYTITMETPLACRAQRTNSTSCVFSDTLTGRVFDFNPLAQKLSFSQDNLTFSACLCPSEACHPASINQTLPSPARLGDFTRISIPSSVSGPKVLFSGLGDTCGVGRRHYQSTIFMECDRNADKAKGRLTLQNGISTTCEKYFVWTTPFACLSPEVSCVLLAGHTHFDFSVLHTEGHDWVVEGDHGDKYLINICGPINPISTKCSSQSSVCVIKGGQYIDLATASTQEITATTDKRAMVSFTGPQRCQGGVHSQVKISLSCGIRGLHFRSNDSCVYHFEWSTPFACNEDKGWSNINCNGDNSDSSNDYHFYPRTLVKSEGYTVTSRYGTFHVSFCGGLAICGGDTSVCLEPRDREGMQPLATHLREEIRVEGSVMQVSLNGSDDKTHVFIRVLCTDGNSSPDTQEQLTLHSHSESGSHHYYYFDMETVKGCSFRPPPSSPPSTAPTAPPSTPHTSTAQGSSAGTVVVALVVVVVIILLTLLVAFVLYKRERREYVLSWLTRVLGSKSSEMVHYRKVPTQEETALLELHSGGEEGEEGEEGGGGSGATDSDDPDDEELLNL